MSEPFAPRQVPLKVQAASQTIQLIGVKKIVGLRAEHIDMGTLDGEWMVRVPAAAFPKMDINPSDMLIVTIAIVRVATQVEAGSPSSLIIPETH